MVCFFEVFVLSILSECLMVVLSLFCFLLLFLLHCFNHVLKFLYLPLVSLSHVLKLNLEFILQDIDISLKFFNQSSNSALLKTLKIFQVNQMIPQCYLVLVLGLVKIFVQHLNESFLRIELPLVVLGVNIDFIL